jgi:hypothetical protein
MGRLVSARRNRAISPGDPPQSISGHYAVFVAVVEALASLVVLTFGSVDRRSGAPQSVRRVAWLQNDTANKSSTDGTISTLPPQRRHEKVPTLSNHRSRVLIGMAQMTTTRWYMERYDLTDAKVKSYNSFSDFASVRSLVATARKAGSGEIIRVLAPSDASMGELDELRDLGAFCIH